MFRKTVFLKRRLFLKYTGLINLSPLFSMDYFKTTNGMNNTFDVIIVGGSFAGLSAAMALGRSHRKVLIIDSGLPCNRQTPHAHNLITHDGEKPSSIAAEAKKQVLNYPSVSFEYGTATRLSGQNKAFEIETGNGMIYKTQKVLFTTGVKDQMPDITGFAECWGVSALHCPYCHGYEVSHQPLGILANGDVGYHMTTLINNWSKDLSLFTNGVSQLNDEQTQKLQSKGIRIVEKPVAAFDHDKGQIKNLVFEDKTSQLLTAVFARLPFTQHCDLPQKAGCEITADGFIKTDDFKRTSIPGIFAAGDNTSMMRSLSVAIAAGSVAGAIINAEMIEEAF